MSPQNKTIKSTILLFLILFSISAFSASSNRVTSISIDAENPKEQVTINLKTKEKVKDYKHGLYPLRKKAKKHFVFYMDVPNCYLLKYGTTFKRKFTNSPLLSIRIGQNKLNPPITRIACDLTRPIKPDIKLKDGYVQVLFSFTTTTPPQTPHSSVGLVNQITDVNVISEEPHLRLSIDLDAKSRVAYGRGMYPVETTGAKSVFYIDIRNARPTIDEKEHFVRKFDNPIVSQMEIVKQQFVSPITRIAFYLNEPINPYIKIKNNRQLQITFPAPDVPFTEMEETPSDITETDTEKPLALGSNSDATDETEEPLPEQELVGAVESLTEQPDILAADGVTNGGKPNPLKSFLSSVFRLYNSINRISSDTDYRPYDNALPASPLDNIEENEMSAGPELLEPLEQESPPRLTEASLTDRALTFQPVIEKVDMKDTDIRDALRMLAKQGGINIVVDDSVQGKVSVSLNKTTPERAIAQVLSANGFAYERLDGYMLAYAPGNSNIPTITEVIPLNYSQVGKIKEVLTSLASSPESVKVDSHTNSVIITDTPSNVRNMVEIVKRLDVQIDNSSLQTQSHMFHLQFANASELQETISNFLSEDGKLAVDKRTNSLIVLDSDANIKTIAQLVQQLDVETTRAREPSQDANRMVTRVFILKYIDANAFKESVEEILSPEGKIQAFLRQKELLKPARQKESDDTRYEEGGLAGKAESEKEEVRKWSNTLIVTDIPSVIQVLEELVEKLDVMAEQVVIEAKIVEVTLDGTHELGINWQVDHEPSGSKFSSHPLNDQKIEPTIQIGTLSAKAFKNITGILHALEEKGQARLLANPRTTTLNNELAQIIVADRFPVPVINFDELGRTTGYEYLDVGILLTVIPHVNEDGYILMEASPQIDSLKEEVVPGAPPVISSRLAHCRVMVKDGQTLVIGGLMKDETSEEISRIPLLGRIPVLGRLFSSKSLKTTKTDLIVFITPHIYRESVE